jgi:hypothetical protein
MSTTVKGSCLCGGVTFEATTPALAFRYCHCTRCQKATGAAHAANLFVPQEQFRWLSGENLLRRYDLPGAKRFAVSFCTVCGTRVPHKAHDTNRVLVPAGLLDGDPEVRPDMGIFSGSRAAWYVAPHELPHHEDYPPA